jgi:PAS domain S-box-containing protein
VDRTQPEQEDGTAPQNGIAPRDALFDDPSEMAAVMSRWDWDEYAVGPPSQWPAALRTIVRVMLSSRFAMWMGWGPELTFFYNDRYRRDTLGIKHPWALGRGAREVWAEIWDDIGPRIEHVLNTGTATWDESLLLFLERSGYREETYHSFSYSPVPGDDGKVAGMLCVVSEETDRVIGDRRLATLRVLGARIAQHQVEADVLEATRASLDANTRDLPFSLAYLINDDATLTLASATGIAPGHRAAPAFIADVARGAPWPIADVLERRMPIVVDDLEDRFGALPTGAWADPPTHAVVVPLAPAGEDRALGCFIAGLNPYRPIDDVYVGFVQLIAGQVAAGIAGARAYDAERRRADALAELDRAKTEFFSNVSHEFRTPLTLIAGPLEDSLSDNLEPLPTSHRERLETIRRNAGRLRRLVNNMLDFARIEAGRMAAETVATDLAAVTRGLALSFAPAIERAGLTFDIDCEPLPRPVFVDTDMWEKIVLNLLSNALKFTVEGEIHLALRGERDVVVLTVADTGVGIPAAAVPQLFQRFHRVTSPEARSYEGTGIGLALVQQLVQLHGGSVSVDTELGAGTTFTVRLPYGTTATAIAPSPRESTLSVYLDEALQWTKSAPSSPLAGDGAARSGATVLVVEDNPDLRSYIANLLRPSWHVLLAPDGQAALELMRETTPDLVLSDVLMPRVDGFALLEAMRADAHLRTVPVILLSARAGEEATLEGLAAGADDYLVKPFASLELLARVRATLELARLRNREAAWRATLVQSLDEGVVICDGTGAAIELNDAFARLVGYHQSGGPYPPPHPWWPDPVGPADDRHDLDEALADLIRVGHVHRRVTLRHRDGHAVPVDLAASPIFDGEQRIFVVTVRDIADELRAVGRQSALTGFAVGLAEASDVNDVVERAAVAFRSVFSATAATVSVWVERDPPIAASATEAGLTEPDPDELTAMRALAQDVTGATDRVTVESAEDAVGFAFAVKSDPGERRFAVRLDLTDDRRLTAEEQALLRVLCGYLAQAARRAQLFDEQRNVATAMQRAILGPSDLPDRVAVRYAPAAAPLEVGGDWYDVVELPGGRIGLIVGDCVGHGLRAATVMGQLRSACRALLLQAKRPADVLDALDDFAQRVPGATCTTVFCAVLDADGTAHYSSAGHIPATIVDRHGGHQLLEGAQSFPLASIPVTGRPEATVTLEPGATLLLCTDGLIERRDESIDDSLDRLRSALVAARRLEPDALVEHVIRTLLPDGTQTDDVAVVVYRHPVDPITSFAVSLHEPAEMRDLRRRFGQWLLDRGLREQAMTDVVVAVGEACANAFEHAYDLAPINPVRVSAVLQSGTLRVSVRDTGSWRERSGPSESRGQGLHLMRGLMDAVDVTSTEHGTTVRLSKKVAHVH